MASVFDVSGDGLQYCIPEFQTLLLMQCYWCLAHDANVLVMFCQCLAHRSVYSTATVVFRPGSTGGGGGLNGL